MSASMLAGIVAALDDNATASVDNAIEETIPNSVTADAATAAAGGWDEMTDDLAELGIDKD